MSATLASLRIRNLALVEDLLWEPLGGFVAITGETGAGKSILLGAVNLLVGERAEKSLVRSGSESCSVEGAFLLDKLSPVHALLEESGAEGCEEGQLILRRTVSVAGPGRQFVNGSPCALALLRKIGDLLVDLHGPHDHQSLFSKDEQLLLLDAFAGARALRSEYSSVRRVWMDLQEEHRRLTGDAAAAAREIDLLAHQTEEISLAALVPGEEDQLLVRQKAAANRLRISDLCAQLSGLASDSEASVSAPLRDIVRLSKDLARLDTRAGPIELSAAALGEGLQEFSRELDRYASDLDDDLSGLAAIEARLDLIQGLKRKYGNSIEEVQTFCGQAAERLQALRNREERGTGLGAEIARAEQSLLAAAKKLTAARTDASPRLAALVKRHLADLGFAKSGFSLALEPYGSPAPAGMEAVEFLFSPNPGEPERPLRSIASSGEISRVMLAIKTALAAQDGVPVLIFDEIDANVGGEIGAKVGAKMKELGSSRQIFCITHLPQVAAQASSHHIVSKEVSGGRTATRLSVAEGAAREAEIARMLGGNPASALPHARALLRDGAAA